MKPSERPCPITWRQECPTPAQLTAWRQLWARLLGYVTPDPETRQPQEDTPGAVDGATVTSGRVHRSDDSHEHTTQTPSRR
jgi:hypothetical protein